MDQEVIEQTRLRPWHHQLVQGGPPWSARPRRTARCGLIPRSWTNDAGISTRAMMVLGRDFGSTLRLSQNSRCRPIEAWRAGFLSLLSSRRARRDLADQHRPRSPDALLSAPYGRHECLHDRDGAGDRTELAGGGIGPAITGSGRAVVPRRRKSEALRGRSPVRWARRPAGRHRHGRPGRSRGPTRRAAATSRRYIR